MPFLIVRDDIARVRADVLVDATNEALCPGGGVAGALFAAAGPQMLEACERIGGCSTGSAVSTPGFGLDCRWVVHAVGPVWRGGAYGEEELLRRCYRSVFAEVVRRGARSVALPLVSAGLSGYPVEGALAVLREEVAAFLDGHPDVEVTLAVPDRSAIERASGLAGEVRRAVDGAHIAAGPRARERGPIGGGARAVSGVDRVCADAAAAGPFVQPMEACLAVSPRLPLDGDLAAPSYSLAGANPGEPCRLPVDAAASPKPSEAECLLEAAPFPRPAAPDSSPVSLVDGVAGLLDRLDEPFSTALLALIDASGMTDAQVYKRANVSRQLFSKIRSHPDYRPTKPTAVAFAVALGLDMDQTRDLLARAGYTLSRSSKFDVIVAYCITRGGCDVLQMNEVLFAYDQPLLGSV